jgi:hypothetical protein
MYVDCIPDIEIVHAPSKSYLLSLKKEKIKYRSQPFLLSNHKGYSKNESHITE